MVHFGDCIISEHLDVSGQLKRERLWPLQAKVTSDGSRSRNLLARLIGRSEEMRIVEAAITASDVSGIVLRGAAGVGKSRIAREGLSAVALRGCEVRWVVGTSSARDIPLGAFTRWAQSGITDTVQLLRGVIESLHGLVSAPVGET